MAAGVSRHKCSRAALLAGTVLVALSGTTDLHAQTTDSIKDGDWADSENWENGRLPRRYQGLGDPGVSANILTRIEVTTGVVASGMSVSGTLEIKGEGGVQLNGPKIFDITGGGRVSIDSENPLALITTPRTILADGRILPGGNGRIGGCTNGTMEVTRGGVDVGGTLNVGGYVSAGAGPACPDGGGGTGVLELWGPDAAVTATGIGVGNSVGTGLFDTDGDGEEEEVERSGGSGSITIHAGTIRVIDSAAVVNGSVSIDGDDSRWIGSLQLGDTGNDRASGSLEILAGGRLTPVNLEDITQKRSSGSVDPAFRATMVSVEQGGRALVDGDSLLAANAIEIEMDGELVAMRGAALVANRLLVGYNGSASGTIPAVRLSGAGTTATLYGYPDEPLLGRYAVELHGDFSGGSDGLLDVRDGAAVDIVSGGLWVAGGRLTVDGASLAVSGPLDVGYDGAATFLGGAKVASGIGLLDLGAIHIDGAGSEWTVAETLTITSINPDVVPALHVTDGGRVTAARIEMVHDWVTPPVFRIVIGRGPGASAPGAPGDIEVTDAIVMQSGAELVFAHTSDNYRFNEALRSLAAGDGLIVNEAGRTVYLGLADDFNGKMEIRGGEFSVVTGLGAGQTTVTGGTLSGTGSIAGAVTVKAGGTLKGASGATLTMGGLTMEAASRLVVALGPPSDAGLFEVDGDLVLDGQLDITGAGRFGNGLYRLIDYGGSLIDNGLDIGITPNGYQAGDLTVQTAIANQVNLLVGTGSGGDPDDPFAFWQGGSGTVRIGEAGFTDDANNTVPLAAGQFLVFMGEGGALQVDDGGGAVEVAGLQFAGDGYELSGDALVVDAPATAIRVGDGTAAGAAMTARIDAPITGSGSIVKTDDGTLVLGGANGFAGGTRIEGGTLSISSDANLGDVAGYLALGGGRLAITSSFGSARNVVVDSGTVDVATGAALTLSGVISGTGELVKTGGGSLVLAGTGSLAGPIRVQAGRLAVNGGFSSAVNLSSGGVLSGTGRVGAVTVGAGATLAPGNSIGTLRVDGALSFEAGSVFEVEADAAGMADRVDVAGAVVLRGGTVSVLAANGNYRPATSYEILTASGGIEGRFADVTSNLAFLVPSLHYSSNGVSLQLRRNDISFADAGGTPNQIATGRAVDSIFGPGTAIYDHLIPSSLDEARATFDALSGEIHSAVRVEAAEDAAELRRALVARDDAPPGSGGFGIWGQATGNWADRKGDGNAASRDASGHRLTIGVEIGGGDRVTLGIAGGGSTFDVGLVARASHAQMQSLFGAFYGSARFGSWRLRGGIAYTDFDVDTRRDVSIPGAGGRLTASYGGSAIQSWGEMGTGLTFGDVRVEPFAGLSGLWLKTDDFAERGAAVALEGVGRSRSIGWTSIGLKMDLGSEAAPVGARARLSWDHGLGAGSMVSALRFAAGGDAFAVHAAPLARDTATVAAGLVWRPAPGLALQGDYIGAFSDRGDRQGVRFAAALRF